jgi:hypothetical protein
MNGSQTPGAEVEIGEADSIAHLLAADDLAGA